MKIVENLIGKEYNPAEGVDQMFRVPNNVVGRVFLYLLGRYMNKANYTIRKRGRCAKRKSDRTYFGDVKLKDAKEVGIYITKKGIKGSDFPTTLLLEARAREVEREVEDGNQRIQ